MKKKSSIPGALRGYVMAFVNENLDGRNICIYGDSRALKSLGEALVAIADLDQKSLPLSQCPPEESFHTH